MQTFQRIQRNRQSRIRVKLSRRAGKRSDEILEEDIVPEPVSNSHQGQHNDLHHHQFQQSRTKMEQPQSSSTPGKNQYFVHPIFCFPCKDNGFFREFWYLVDLSPRSNKQFNWLQKHVRKQFCLLLQFFSNENLK